MKRSPLLLLALGACMVFLTSCNKSSDGPTAPEPDKQSPTVSIAQPSVGATLTGSVTIAMNASDNVGVSKVDFYANNQLQGSISSAPWTYAWNTASMSDGNYSLAAWAYDAAGNVGYSSNINVSVSNPYHVTFHNMVFTDVTVSLQGQSSQAVSPNRTTTFSIPGSVSSASYSALTYGQTNSGMQVGMKMTWSYAIDLSAGKNIDINLMASSQVFFLCIVNNGLRALSPLYVNYGLVSQTYDNISIPADGQTYSIGYYLAYTNTQVRAYVSGTTSYAYWNQGSNFSLPFTSNQTVTLTNTFSGYRIDSAPPVVDLPEQARKSGAIPLGRISEQRPKVQAADNFGHLQE